MKFFRITTFLLLAMFFGPGVFAQSSAIDTSKIGDNPLIGKYVQVRGISMYYETYGKGQPVLFIHGNGGSISNFMYQIPFFASHFQVIAADSRAQGKTVDTGDSLSYEMVADDLSALLDKLHVDSCEVLGWSDGATEALWLAIRHPKKVKKLVLTGARLWTDSSSVDPVVTTWATNYIASFDHMKQTAEVKNNRKVAKLMVNQTPISIEQLQRVDCPTLVIAGDHDIVLPQHTLLISESLPNSDLWILPNSGNAILVDQTALYNGVVDHFLTTPFKKMGGLDRFN
ncbi:MAG: alpha/beta hydrolase [Bacteroidota bacterium]|nr:alpha/beta hydrolase [Bacteroidota bacterium]